MDTMPTAQEAIVVKYLVGHLPMVATQSISRRKLEMDEDHPELPEEYITKSRPFDDAEVDDT